MPQTDGQIESKQLGTASVNSRVIDDLRSSNYNGSKTDPESNPGTTGWQILKSGVVVVNNAIIRGLLSAAEILSGDLNIRSAGRLTVGDTGTAEAPIAPLVVLDVNGLNIGSGLTVIDNTGVQVGSNVVIDSTGLWVAGGLTRAVEPQRRSDGVVDATITTTEATYATVTFTPPSWAQSMILWAAIRGQFQENTLQKNVNIGYRIGTGSNFDMMIQTLIVGATQSFTNFTSFEEDAAGISLPNPFNLHVRASVNTGTNTVNRIGLRAHALFLR